MTQVSDRASALTPSKSKPHARGTAARFYAAAAEHRLVLGLCQSCGHRFLPRVVCPACGSTQVELAQVDGRGTVYSFSVSHRAGQPGFETDVPYVVAVVQLESGVRLMTNLPGVPHDQVRIGMPVVVTFEDRDGMTIPQFRQAP